jgi:hypothetical protein
MWINASNSLKHKWGDGRFMLSLQYLNVGEVVDKLPDENCSHQSGGWDGLAHAECPISDPIVCKLMMLPELSKAVTFTLLAIKASCYLSLCFTIQPDEGPPLQGRCKWFLLESFIWLHSVLKPVWHKVIFISSQDLYFWWPENLPSWVVEY